MQLNPSEISELIKQRIGDFEVVAQARTEGHDRQSERRHRAYSRLSRRHAGRNDRIRRRHLRVDSQP